MGECRLTIALRSTWALVNSISWFCTLGKTAESAPLQKRSMSPKIKHQNTQLRIVRPVLGFEEQIPSWRPLPPSYGGPRVCPARLTPMEWGILTSNLSGQCQLPLKTNMYTNNNSEYASSSVKIYFLSVNHGRSCLWILFDNVVKPGLKCPHGRPLQVSRAKSKCK